MNFTPEKTIEQLLRLIARKHAAQIELEEYAKTITTLSAELISVCQQPCREAIEEYNTSHFPTINPGSWALALNPEWGMLSVKVHMYNEKGYELDEEISGGEAQEYTKNFRTYIEKHLEKAGIGLSFSGLVFPIHYYAK